MNEHTKQKQTHRCRKQTDGCRVGGVRRRGDEGEGLGSTDRPLQSSHRDVKSSTGNIGDNTVVTTYSARQVLEISGNTWVNI